VACGDSPPPDDSFGSGDHLHPQDTGYQAMAEGIDLEMLGVKP
jgi:hypothetical protein